MSVPLDRLYHYIESLFEDIRGDAVLIYRFWPHGSKNIKNLLTIRDRNYFEISLAPRVVCYDQEPLNYKLYDTPDTLLLPRDPVTWKLTENNIWDQCLLLHSEQRSEQVDLYADNDYIPIYYWSHAVIARDWFRYAEHAGSRKQSQRKLFLIYNRAWGGTREYRLKFTNMLIESQLDQACHSAFNPIEPELQIHYKNFTFANPVWRPTEILENHFPLNTSSSCYSADFDMNDYDQTEIEVVLETLFDDTRLHLTEKTLRPIACAQPFVLAGTHGSLAYIRGYGFKTFDTVWDESYDLVEDPYQRMCAIIKLMKDISGWSPEVRAAKLDQARRIADFNKRHFFGPEFMTKVMTEFKDNVTRAFDELERSNTSTKYLAWRKKRYQLNSHKLCSALVKTNRQDVVKILQHALKYKDRTQHG